MTSSSLVLWWVWVASVMSTFGHTLDLSLSKILNSELLLQVILSNFLFSPQWVA